MDPNTPRIDVTKAATAGAQQSMSPQTSATGTIKRTAATRGSTQQQGVSLSAPAGQGRQQTGRRRTNSS